MMPRIRSIVIRKIIAKSMKVEPNLLSYRRITVVDNHLFSSIIEPLTAELIVFLLFFDKLCTFFTFKNRVFGSGRCSSHAPQFLHVTAFPAHARSLTGR